VRHCLPLSCLLFFNCSVKMQYNKALPYHGSYDPSELSTILFCTVLFVNLQPIYELAKSMSQEMLQLIVLI